MTSKRPGKISGTDATFSGWPPITTPLQRFLISKSRRYGFNALRNWPKRVPYDAPSGNRISNVRAATESIG
jgi:hypothetical protein